MSQIDHEFRNAICFLQEVDTQQQTQIKLDAETAIQNGTNANLYTKSSVQTGACHRDERHTASNCASPAPCFA